jgi:hypothetical protein
MNHLTSGQYSIDAINRKLQKHQLNLLQLDSTAIHDRESKHSPIFITNPYHKFDIICKQSVVGYQEHIAKKTSNHHINLRDRIGCFLECVNEGKNETNEEKLRQLTLRCMHHLNEAIILFNEEKFSSNRTCDRYYQLIAAISNWLNFATGQLGIDCQLKILHHKTFKSKKTAQGNEKHQKISASLPSHAKNEPAQTPAISTSFSVPMPIPHSHHHAPHGETKASNDSEFTTLLPPVNVEKEEHPRQSLGNAKDVIRCAMYEAIKTGNIDHFNQILAEMKTFSAEDKIELLKTKNNDNVPILEFAIQVAQQQPSGCLEKGSAHFIRTMLKKLMAVHVAAYYQLNEINDKNKNITKVIKNDPALQKIDENIRDLFIEKYSHYHTKTSKQAKK